LLAADRSANPLGLATVPIQIALELLQTSISSLISLLTAVVYVKTAPPEAFPLFERDSG